VWQKVWAQFGVTAEELREHFSGPSFLAWNRMGNLHGYAGPLPQSYIDDQAGEHSAWRPLVTQCCEQAVLGHVK
jgi:hypothetical protein